MEQQVVAVKDIQFSLAPVTVPVGTVGTVIGRQDDRAGRVKSPMLAVYFPNMPRWLVLYIPPDDNDYVKILNQNVLTLPVPPQPVLELAA